MQRFEHKFMLIVTVATILLGACAQRAPVIRPDAEAKKVPQVESPAPAPAPARVRPPAPPRFDAMADVQGDRPLPELQGEIERIDCTSGVDELHARMALEARGGQIASFAYYSKWKPRTCSLEFERDAPNTKWRLTADGATRVQTPNGRFVIRAQPDAYVFEFQNVQRKKFCGMRGYTNGTMTVKRNSSIPECSVAGLLDREE